MHVAVSIPLGTAAYRILKDLENYNKLGRMRYAQLFSPHFGSEISPGLYGIGVGKRPRALNINAGRVLGKNRVQNGSTVLSLLKDVDGRQLKQRRKYLFYESNPKEAIMALARLQFQGVTEVWIKVTEDYFYLNHLFFC